MGSVPFRSVPRRRNASTTSVGSQGVDSSAASAAPAAPAELPQLSLNEIMSSPSRRPKPRLHPDRPERPKDVWFGLDDCVRTDISSIYQNDFKGPWSCISNVPLEHQKQWWSRFAQRYFWEDEHHDAVIKLYRKQLKELLKNLISKGKRDGVKPDFVSDDDWNLMVERWDTKPAMKKSKRCSGARKSQRSGYGAHCHTGGSKPFTKIEYEMTEKIMA
ncbi:PREDICTED: uncharacterized protein LOC104741917 [Camelina sativa]|uniref:Uncharacterized protein LOC104741917 n=1 Tax=Camelina sativa TaxID=90675 RepID=A0ABM0VU60_CAMSA|nr:PREDICTED: uncharacterized protein LOC104741917 [Camelina sativa]